MITVTDDNFDAEVLKADKPVLVDFNASWCPPCRMQEPELEELESEIEGRAIIASCDIDESPQMAADFEVSSIPCLILFKNGEEVARKVGFTAKKKLLKLLGEK